MYAWIFRHLPGPTWLKAIWAVVLVAVAIYALFRWAFPWAQEVLRLNENTIG